MLCLGRATVRGRVERPIGGLERQENVAEAEIGPHNAIMVVLSFEGPDQYAQAGGLGVRVAELGEALAAAGFETYVLFVGDPHAAGREVRAGGKLTLYRWSQWISAYYPAGVYAGEEDKLRDWNASLPPFVVDSIAAPAVAAGKIVVVLAEEWHTAESLATISDLLHWNGIRKNALLLWNANNVFSFWRLDWTRLAFVSQLTTVSRYMRHLMWNSGLDPLVIPNGIPGRLLTPDHELDSSGDAASSVREIFPERLLLFKIGRFDPDKRWMMAVEAVARLKERGQPVLLLVRGGIEPHGHEVLTYARQRGLGVHDLTSPPGAPRSVQTCLDVLRNAPPGDVYNLRFFLPEEFVHLLYRAADAVLANSGHEPFGLVGLEVMAAGGLAVTGATGEDYAVGFQNAIVVETQDPGEIVASLLYLRSHPEEAVRMRAAGRSTARLFTWDQVLITLQARLAYLARAQGLLGG
jgi:glycosyltransferase involved in cell wall biosynthesis